MARKPRIEFEGAFYHVIARGNHYHAIFHDDPDRLAYLKRLEDYRRRYGFTLYAYVLMVNHVHLLLETHHTPLSKIMQGLQFTYTQYYNRRYRKVGHLFQGRYRAILCDRDAYLLELVRYLHLNPARVRRPVNPFRYPWSSHRVYLGEPSLVDVETSLVLAQFGQRLDRARQAYLEFMKQGLGLAHDNRFYETVDQRLLGDARFIAKVERKTRGRLEIGRPSRRVPFARLLRAVADVHGVEPAALVQQGRQRAQGPARAMLVYLGRERSQLTTQELGLRLQRDPSMISRLYAHYAADRDVDLESQVARALRAAGW